MQLYVNRDGQRTGPHSIEEVNRQLAAGTLDPTDQAWSESSPGWKPLLSFSGVIMPGGASSTAASISIATPQLTELIRYAGFWIRTVAFVIDGIILGFVLVVIVSFFKPTPGQGSGPTALVAFLSSAIGMVYMAALWSSSMQATFGQKICGLQVIHAIHGDRISFMCGLGRAFAMVLSGILFGIGYLMVAFTERKRGLHDIIAGTCVIKSREQFL
ncbi:MAG: RDD family protein [Verrucomicrobiota bacterium]|nr:RDD family protein [Verrucomicrobiota bacterium]